MIVGATPYATSSYAVRLSGPSRTLLAIDAASGPAYALSCATAAACSAVGGNDAVGVAASAARWDGRTWTGQDLSAATGSVDAVSCVAADRCMAVGSNTVVTEGF